MIKELKDLQKDQKRAAKADGAWPKGKVIEECCEVLIDHLEGKDTTSEEIDLLMCLIDKYWVMHAEEGWDGDLPLQQWYSKMRRRDRETTVGQSGFLHALLNKPLG